MNPSGEPFGDREALDRAYNAKGTVSAAVFEKAMRDYRDFSERARSSLPGNLDIVYDQSSGQTLDILSGGSYELKPVFLFVHGGYWRALSKLDSAFMAPALAESGIATAVLDYRLAPSVKLAEIVRETRAAVAFLWRQGRALGVDPDRIFVGGSSAGGHLTGAVLSGGWHDAFEVPANVIKGAMPISGLFDLAPLAHTHVQEWMKFDAETIRDLSPITNLPARGCPIVVAYADSEAEGFERQSQDYHRLWTEAGFPSRLMRMEGRNHYDVVLDLASKQSALAKALVSLICGD